MSLSTQDDKRKSNIGKTGSCAIKTKKPLKANSNTKILRILKPDLVKITDKGGVLDKIKNSHKKPYPSYTYKVQKMNNVGKKKQSSLRMLKKTDNAGEPKDNIHQNVSTNDDPTPRNKDDLTLQKSYDTLTQNNANICIWHSVEAQVTLSLDSELNVYERTSGHSLEEYLYLENQTKEDTTFNWKDFNNIKLSGQDNGLLQPTELMRYGTKTFRSQATSTNDLFKFKKLSAFSAIILQKCLELEQTQLNTPGSTGSSSQIVTLAKEPSPKSTYKMPSDYFNKSLLLYENEDKSKDWAPGSQDNSDKILDIYKGKGKPEDCFPIREPNPNSMGFWIMPISLIIIGLIILLVGIIYIYYFTPVPPPKSIWQKWLKFLANLWSLY